MNKHLGPLAPTLKHTSEKEAQEETGAATSQEAAYSPGRFVRWDNNWNIKLR